ncbi:MAG: hypothetical protein MR601_01295 [Erysipelotrichaceae bacterium]|nr:hypothetical protein [Erysipelotrichaceae bacterium]
MAKLVKTKKKKTLKFQNFSFFFTFVSGFMYLISSLFLRSYNNSLSLKKQSIISQINTIEVENEAINIAIQNLSTRDRVVAIANENGLNLDQNNIITITNGE